MSNHKNLRAIIKKMSGQDNIITIPKIFVEFLDGDLTTALVLNQMVFFSDKSKRKDGYFFKGYEEWEEETGLSRRRIKYSVDKLIKMELVNKKLKKAYGAPTLHYQLDYDKVLDSIYTKCTFPSEQSVRIPDSDKVYESLTDDLQMNYTDESSSSPPDDVVNSLSNDENPHNMFQKCFGIFPSGMISQQINSYISDGMEDKVVAAAIYKAAQNGKEFGYARGILNNWFRDKIFTYEQVKAEQERYASKKKEAKPLQAVNGGQATSPKLKDRKPAAWTLDE